MLSTIVNEFSAGCIMWLSIKHISIKVRVNFKNCQITVIFQDRSTGEKCFMKDTVLHEC